MVEASLVIQDPGKEMVMVVSGVLWLVYTPVYRSLVHFSDEGRGQLFEGRA